MRQKGHTTPVVIVTASDRVADRIAGLDAGADDYLINPFDIDELAEALYLGLMMDEPQKKARQAKIREVVRTNDITRWISLQLQDLRELID